MSLLESVVTGIQIKPQRVLIYGVEGIGKTEIAAQFPGCIFLAAEDGTSHIDTARFVPSDWQQAMEFLAALASEEVIPYQTLAIDTVKWIEQLCDQFVCKRENVEALADISYGRGKGFLYSEFQSFVRWCSYLYGRGLNIILIGHATVIQFHNPEGDNYDRYTLQMSNKSVAEQLKQWSDVVAFMNYDTHIEEKQDGMRKTRQAKSLNRRLMHLERSVAFDAKNRFHFPRFIDCGQSPLAAYQQYMQEYSQWPERHAQMLAATPAAA